MSEEYDHMVIVESPSFWSHLSKRTWCESRMDENDFYIMTTSSTDAWFFKKEEDAVAFKLRFKL